MPVFPCIREVSSNAYIRFGTLPSAETTVALPPSKSIAARQMMIAAYADAPLPQYEEDWCDDLRHLHRAITAVRRGEAVIDVGSSGTALRFIATYICMRAHVKTVLTGSGQLQRRPIAPLVNALASLGCRVRHAGADGHAPLEITPGEICGGEVEVDTSESSQYLSSLLLAAPWTRHGLHIRCTGTAVSTPYSQMTLQMLRAAGAETSTASRDITVSPGRLTPDKRPPESDWSAASYMYETVALHPPGTLRIRMEGLRRPQDTLQGDNAIASIYRQLGVKTTYDDSGATIEKTTWGGTGHFDIYMGDIIDLVPAVAATLCGCRKSFRLYGIAHLRHKESDRLASVSAMLRSLGHAVTAAGDTLESGHYSPPETPATVDAAGDHRIAMAAAPLAIFSPMNIRDAACVDKSFPGYFDRLAQLGYDITLTNIQTDTP